MAIETVEKREEKDQRSDEKERSDSGRNTGKQGITHHTTTTITKYVDGLKVLARWCTCTTKRVCMIATLQHTTAKYQYVQLGTFSHKGQHHFMRERKWRGQIPLARAILAFKRQGRDTGMGVWSEGQSKLEQLMGANNFMDLEAVSSTTEDLDK